MIPHRIHYSRTHIELHNHKGLVASQPLECETAEERLIELLHRSHWAMMMEYPSEFTRIQLGERLRSCYQVTLPCEYEMKMTMLVLGKLGLVESRKNPITDILHYKLNELGLHTSFI